LHIGSDTSTTNHINGTFTEFDVYNRALTAAEVAADYANIQQVIADGQGLGGIPYIWTKDGDNVVDNADAGANENWCVIGGVQGDLPAEVEASMTVGGMAAADLYMGRLDWDYDEFIDPNFLVNNSAGTVPISPSDGTITYIGFADDEFRLVAGRKFAAVVRASDSGSANNISMRTGVRPGAALYYSAYEPVNYGSAAATAIDTTPDIYIVQDEEFYRTLGITRAGSVFIGAKRASGTSNLIVQSVGLLPSPRTRFTNLAGGTAYPTLIYTNGNTYEVTGGTALAYTYQTDGKPFEVAPNKYNVLVTYMGREAVASPGTVTLTYNSVYVTPRWKVQ